MQRFGRDNQANPYGVLIRFRTTSQGVVLPCGTVDRTVAWRKEHEMNLLYWALIFLVVALIAAVLGFAGLAAAAAGIARILFFIFLVIFLILLVLALMGRKPPRVP